MMVAIIDYGMGNVASVEKALTYLGVQSKLTKIESDIEDADFLILPGVGAFDQGMANLREAGLVDILTEQVIEKQKPFLGICLGMQLIAEKGYENNESKGLGWINGEVVRIEDLERSVPHLGWNDISVKKDCIFSEFSNMDFFFIHSFHFKVQETDSILATVNYGGDYVAAVMKDNIVGFQFHPEKSQDAGLKLMKKYFNSYA